MAHLADESLPPKLYSAAQEAIILYAQRSTRLQPIDNDTYAALSRHFSAQQIIDITLTVGLSNMINRFHATFHTDLDADTTKDAESGDVIAGACPIPRPKPPSP
jgi:alkylhydroperoxidase family enzyme